MRQQRDGPAHLGGKRCDLVRHGDRERVGGGRGAVNALGNVLGIVQLVQERPQLLLLLGQVLVLHGTQHHEYMALTGKKEGHVKRKKRSIGTIWAWRSWSSPKPSSWARARRSSASR